MEGFTGTKIDNYRLYYLPFYRICAHTYASICIALGGFGAISLFVESLANGCPPVASILLVLTTDG